MIPEHVKHIYPNHICNVFGKPLIVFRDHRWTLPVIFLAGERGLVDLPIKVVTLDRHRDSLSPLKRFEALKNFRVKNGTFDELVQIVMKHLSPRDDDWIVSGMEMGILSDVVQFSSEMEKTPPAVPVTFYTDTSGITHRIFHLDSFVEEMSYKGALADRTHQAAVEGLWDILGWEPSCPGLLSDNNDFIFDLDLDFFTMNWGKYTLPFTKEVYLGEFLTPCQSQYYDDYIPMKFVQELLQRAKLITIASSTSSISSGSSTMSTLLRNTMIRGTPT